MTKKWENYEDIAIFLLNKFAGEFGLDKVEKNKKIEGLRSGTEWAIDAKGIKEGNEGFIIIECRRYTTSRQNQEKIGALAYRIMDTGAEGGIIISPLGIQEGAAKVASAEKIQSVQLHEESTAKKYLLSFLDRIMTGITDAAEAKDSVSCKVIK